jgi:hypothetical protein
MTVQVARQVADQRLLQATSGNLTVTLRDSDGEPNATPSGVTVTVTRSDGTALATAQSAVSDGEGVWHYALTAAQTATLDILSATWTASAVVVARTLHEIVGGYYFSAAEARATETSTAPKSKYPDLDVIDKRREVEDEFERICCVAFVPRYRKALVSGTDSCSVLLPDPMVRTIRSVRAYTYATSYIDFTSDQLAALVVNEAGRLERTDGGRFFSGCENIVVAYEHGYDRPPADVKRAAITRLRERLNAAKKGIPDRATSFSASDGGTYGLARANAFATGNDEVDAVLDRYSFRHP